LAFPHFRVSACQRFNICPCLPRAVCPELDNVIANLELMPMRANASKNAKIGSRQVQKADDLNRGGLLSKEGLAKVRASWHQ